MTNICLQAVQKALESLDRSSANLLFTPKDSAAASSVHSSVTIHRTHSKSNIESLLLYRLLMIQHPWKPPKDSVIPSTHSSKSVHLPTH